MRWHARKRRWLLPLSWLPPEGELPPQAGERVNGDSRCPLSVILLAWDRRMPPLPKGRGKKDPSAPLKKERAPTAARRVPSHGSAPGMFAEAAKVLALQGEAKRYLRWIWISIPHPLRGSSLSQREPQVAGAARLSGRGAEGVMFRHDVGIVPYGRSRDVLRILPSNSSLLTPNSSLLFTRSSRARGA